MDAILQELASRWRGMYSSLEQGRDVPPGIGLRAEGMMEAAVICGAASAVQLDELLSTCYRECTGRALTTDLGEKTGEATAVVQAWYSGQRANYGIQLQGDESPDRGQ